MLGNFIQTNSILKNFFITCFFFLECPNLMKSSCSLLVQFLFEALSLHYIPRHINVF